MTDDSTSVLSPEHAAYLTSHAIDLDLAVRLGVRSLLSHADNPQEGLWVNWANHPAIVFPWTNEAGEVEYQVRPDKPTEDKKGRLRKYVFRADMTPVLWAARPVEDATTMLIVEGTKQTLAAATYAPDDVAVYGIAGCRSWQIDGQPIADLMAADGRNVVVALDADAADNPLVYDAGIQLGQALTMEGAAKVTFARLPGGGTSGLDDVLAKRPEARRTPMIARLIESAKTKPADLKPKPKKKSQEPPSGEGDRKTIVVNRDRLLVINDLTAALLDRWNAVELFCHGGVISRRKGATMAPVDRGTFNDVVQETASTVNENEGANGTTYSYSWPDPNSMAAVLSRAEKFAKLDRISHAPFVREDGSIVTEPGYDEATRTMLIPDPVFADMTVPGVPSDAEIRAARDLIFTEWLGDFPFDSDVDRSNLLALLVTPAIRGMVPKVPLAVIDGLQMGVGKNLLADSILTVYTGQAAEPMNWVPEADELRKQITAAFRTGAEFFVFDEAHTVEGAPLAQALTATTWQDRILGVSTMANFPNVITWMSLGNNVQVKGDLTRRVYRIALRPRYANPQDRKAETFRHPGTSGLDLGSWTRKHRAEIMGAILTLVRAWFAKGQPRPKRGVSFGSFEIWERITGGIIETAGLVGFLDNLKIWRSESDFDTQYWAGHLGWLRDQFGSTAFRTAQVRERALADPAGYLAPPKLDDVSDKGYGKALGEAYSRLRGRRYDGLWIERNGFAHGHVSVWSVFKDGENPPTEENPTREPTPPPVEPDTVDCPHCSATSQDLPAHLADYHNSDDALSTERAPENEHAMARGPAPEDTDGEGHDEVRGPARPEAGVVTFDLETGDAGNLYKTPGTEYIHIGATATDDEDVVPYDGPGSSVPRAVTADLRLAGTITGHNIMAFDLPALVRAGTLTMPEVHRMAADGRFFDGLLAGRYLDPPMAKDKGVDTKRKYDLGAMGEKYGLGAKLTDVSGALAKKYGGWDEIPFDDSEDGRAFKTYMVQDVELSRRLHATLLEQMGGTVPEYLVREHRIAAIGAQITANGFLVDQAELSSRIEKINTLTARSLAWLVKNAGVPLNDAKGKPYKSPLASNGGKDAIEKALTEAGVTSLWRTASGQLDMSGDHMLHLGQEYHHLPQVRAVATCVYRIVGARSVYQTAMDHLCPDGRVHPKVSFEQATGRWSVTKPGLTVFGKRGGRHVERAVFLPDPGEVLIAVDMDQVDMRALAGLSQDKAYIEMLKTDDPHSEIALALFGDVKRREDAKAIGHGWNYGRGIKAISDGADIDPALVRQFDTSMRERFPRLVEWQSEVRAIAESGAMLNNGFGRLMRADPQRAHTQAPALMGQGAARDLMMTGLLNLPAEILPMLRAQIHDEIVLSVPADRLDEIGQTVVNAFTFEWNGVPIRAGMSKPGTTWAGCYEK